jgi:arginyl-tRNA synthetase
VLVSVEALLRARFAAALSVVIPGPAPLDPMLKAADPRHADYQSNVAMAHAKRLGKNPRQLATDLVAALQLEDICLPPEIAGPGFINLRLSPAFLAQQLSQLLTTANTAPTSNMGIPAHDSTVSPSAPTVVIDYSGPNVAKQLHVGHLRSTIIGDTLARVMDYLGHNVIRQNHIGDFGTQFGMLIHHLRTLELTNAPLSIELLDQYYKEATDRFKNDPDFRAVARQTVVELQSGAPDAVALWNRMRVETHRHYTEVYAILGVTLTDDHERGESFYRERLPLMVARVKATLPFRGEIALTTPAPADDLADDTDDAPLTAAAPVTADAPAPEPVTEAFAAISNGAFCVFLPGYLDRAKKPLPLMLQKADGGYPYTATDLAGCYFRVCDFKTTPADQKPLTRDWHADRVIILTDSRQSQHFAMVFDAFRAGGWAVNPVTKTPVSMEHAPFGSILGEDGKPFKTRSGDTVKLKDLLDEAIARAAAVVAEKNPTLPPAQQAAIARAVGIGAIKYADLKQDRTTDYIFSWDRMLAFEGNTGPYLLYTYARICSILRKADLPATTAPAALTLDQPAELALARKLLAFPDIVQSVARDLKPHYLCTYLYELASAYSTFYEQCPVLKAEDPARTTRLHLCAATQHILALGLRDLLGIPVVTEM